MKYTIMIIGASCALSLISCDNPADATTDAKVTEAQEVATADASSAEKYTFTDNSKVTFVGSKISGDSKTGEFKKTKGHFEVVDGKPVSGGFTIDMSSIHTEYEKLTEHLKNEDFFNVPEFPQSSFEVTEFGEVKDGAVVLSGNLKMKDVTKNITIPAQVQQADGLIKLTSEFDINRHDWGIDYAGKADDLIRKEVVISLNLEAKKD